MNFFGGTFFDGGFFGQATTKTGTGGIDPQDLRRRIFKPTGLLDRRPKNIPTVEARTSEVRDIHAEVSQRLAQEFAGVRLEFKPIQEMTSKEIDHEIGLLMREKIRKDEEEETMLVLMIALNE